MKKILVIGDTCLDINHFGKVERISPEAPVPIFNYDRSEYKLGMSGNVALNLKKHLNNEVTLFLKCGNEVQGRQILDMIQQNGIKYSVPLIQDNVTITKERYFVGSHYLFRVDNEKIENIYYESIDEIVDSNFDCIILQDYAKGCITDKLINDIIANKSPNCLIVADGHPSRSAEFYHGVDYLKLNEKEFNSIFKEEFSLNIALEKIRGIVVTRADKPTILYEKGITETMFEVQVPENVIDVTGAGDVFVANFVSEMLLSNDPSLAINLANRVASYSTTKLGCYAPTLEEILNEA